MQEIVIKIPDITYEVCISKELEDKDLTTFQLLIRYGTPLPKGHGRIADMDEAIKCIKDVEGEDAIWAISLIEWACTKRTIIEADKAENEEMK